MPCVQRPVERDAGLPTRALRRSREAGHCPFAVCAQRDATTFVRARQQRRTAVRTLREERGALGEQLAASYAPSTSAEAALDRQPERGRVPLGGTGDLATIRVEDRQHTTPAIIDVVPHCFARNAHRPRG